MTRSEPLPEALRRDIVAAARAIIRGEADLVEGCRRLASLAHAADRHGDELFRPIRAVDSETDHFPPPGARPHYSPRALERLDREREEYIRWAGPHVAAACRAIVEELSGTDRRARVAVPDAPGSGA